MEHRPGLKTVAKCYLQMITSLYDLYKMLQVQLPPKSVGLEATMSAFGVVFEELTEEKAARPQFNLSRDVQRKLRQIRDKVEEVGRLLFMVGVNDTNEVSDALTGYKTMLERKVLELAKLRKDFLKMASPGKLGNASRSIKNEDARILWEQSFGKLEQVSLDTFYEQICEILGRRPRCPKEYLESFFGGNIVTLDGYNRFINVANANNIYANKDQVLVGNARNFSSFLAVQKRIGHLHVPVSKDRVDREEKPMETELKTTRKRKKKRHSKVITKLPALVPVPIQQSRWVPETTARSTTVPIEVNPKTGRWLFIRSKVEKWFAEVDEISRYFYGNLTREEAELMLKDEIPGTYFLRYNSEKPDNICVSFVHEVKYSENHNWKDLLMRKFVIVHQTLNAKYVYSQPELPIIWQEGLIHRRNISGHKALSEFERFLKACSTAEGGLSMVESSV